MIMKADNLWKLLFTGIDINQFRKIQVFDGEKMVDEIIGVGGFAIVSDIIMYVFLLQREFNMNKEEQYKDLRESSISIYISFDESGV